MNVKLGGALSALENKVQTLEKKVTSEVKTAETAVAQQANTGWVKTTTAVKKAGNEAMSLGAEAVGVAELAGLRYSVKQYQSKVSDGLTRGSRLEKGSDYAELKDRGFKSIVDLTLEGTKDAQLAGPAGLNALNVKILDNSAPTQAQMKQFLDFATSPANQPCYVHCEAGQGRTGVATACYRMAVQGWSADQALAEAKTFGLKLPNQVEFIQSFGAALKAGQLSGYPKTATAPQQPTFATPPAAAPKTTLAQSAQAKLAGLEQELEAKGKMVKTLMNGVPGAVGKSLRTMVDFSTDTQAYQRVASMSDAQLASMRDVQLGQLAQQLLDPSLASEAVGANATQRSEQALRLLTAHGVDAGHVDGVLSHMQYGRKAVDQMEGPSKARLSNILDTCKATPGDWMNFDKYLDTATCTQAQPGTKVEPLIDGKEAFPAMFAAVDGAKSSVNMSVYAFHSDETGWTMAKKLAAAADRGCAVKLVYDPMGSKDSGGEPTDPAVYQYMKDHGVQVVAQTPGPLADHLTHRKITVVDGQTGFIGGMNVGDDYATVWHDVHSKMTGPGVADLQKLFVEQWKDNGQPVSAAEQKAFFPTLETQGTASARVIGHVGQNDQSLKLAYLRAIDTATTSINIANPYFSDPDVAAHMKAAAQRGVQVTLVVPQENDAKFNQGAARALYADLIAGGVNVYEYFGKPMAHEKVATFDGQRATIGSTNLDARSLGNNDEANAWLDDAKATKQLDQSLFVDDLAKCTRITPQVAAQMRASTFNRVSEQLGNEI
jgi:cardiolipin synthase